ncbi:MAG: hypothetical protein K2N33_06235 [Clostridia bacterium]|nr:hypothetical protein [Clostridia bacterium]
MKKTIFLIAALLAVGTMGLAGCHTSGSGTGGNADEIQPRTNITEDIDEDNNGNDTDNNDNGNGSEDEQKPPHCEGRMPHKPHRGGHNRPFPRPMPRPDRR